MSRRNTPFSKDRMSYYLLSDERVPLSIRSAFAKADNASSPEQELWREILARAIFDAIGSTGLQKPDEHNVAVASARNWIKFSHVDVQTIIDLADVRTTAEDMLVVLTSHPNSPHLWRTVKERQKGRKEDA